jgi:O-antigen ligase
MLGLGIFKTFFGWGLSEYFPYVTYGLAFLVAFLALFYRSEIGILFIAFFLPIYTLLNKAIKLGLPLANQILDILLIAMVLGWLFQNRKKQEPSIGQSPLLLPIVIFVSYSLLSFFIGSSYLGEDIIPGFDNVRLANWKNYMIMPLLYLISYYNLRDDKWKYALFILLFVSFLAMDFKFRQTFRWVEHTHYVPESRVAGTMGFLGPNEWGSFHAIYTLFIIGLFLVDKNFWRRAAYLILIFGGIYSLMYSFSRGAYAGFLAGLFFIGFIRTRKLLIPLIVFLFVWKLIVPLSVMERVTGTVVEQSEGRSVVSVGGVELETAGRIRIWKDALGDFYKNPITGMGYGSYQRLAWWDTHNVYIKHLTEQGLIGLFIYLGLYLLALRSGWRLYRRADEELVKALGFGFLCAVIGSMVVNFFGDRWTYLQLGGLYWIFWALVDQENSKLKLKLKKVPNKNHIGGSRVEGGGFASNLKQ